MHPGPSGRAEALSHNERRRDTVSSYVVIDTVIIKIKLLVVIDTTIIKIN